MGQLKLTDNEWRASYPEAVNKFERARSIKIILARLGRRVTVATVIQYGIIAAFISIIIVSAFSLRVH